MSPIVSRLYKSNLESIFKMQKLFVRFIYELQPSFHIHILFPPVYKCFTEKAPHRILYELQPSLRTYTLLPSARK